MLQDQVVCDNALNDNDVDEVCYQEEGRVEGKGS